MKPRTNLLSGLKQSAVTVITTEIAARLTDTELPWSARLLLAMMSLILGCGWKTLSLEIRLHRNGNQQHTARTD